MPRCLDLLLSGEVVQTLDTLVQRLKAVEMASSESSWVVAQHLELIPPAKASAILDQERATATKEAQKALKLQQGLDRQRKPSPIRG